MALLDEPSVLDALGASSELSLSSKLSLAQVNSAINTAIWKIFRSGCICVHSSDRTVANAYFLVHILLNDALDNDNLDMVLHVKGKCTKRQVKLVRLHGHIGRYSYDEYELNGPDGVLDHTTTYFLGHVFARHAYCGRDAYVKLTTGEVVNLRKVQESNRIHQTITGLQKMKGLDRAIVSGSLLRNAERRITKENVENFQVGVCNYKGRLDLNCLQLEDDQMCHLAPRIRALGESIRTMNMCGNRFGLQGAVMLLGNPQRHTPAMPQWPVLEKLLFSETPIGAGYESLCNAILNKQMPNLKSLHLCNTGLGPLGARLLFESLPNAPKLEVLSLSENPIGCGGLTPLERPPPNQIVLPSLKELNVAFSDDFMHARGYRVLAQALLSNSFPKLVSIFTMSKNAACVDLAMEAVFKRREFSAAESKARRAMAKIIS